MNEPGKLRSISSIVSPLEHRVLRMRFVEGLTQRQVAALIQRDQPGVGVIEQDAIEKLREARNFVIDLDVEYF